MAIPLEFDHDSVVVHPGGSCLVVLEKTDTHVVVMSTYATEGMKIQIWSVLQGLAVTDWTHYGWRFL